MIDIELIEDRSIRVRKKDVPRAKLFPQGTVNFRRGGTDRIDLDTIVADCVIVFLELSQLHPAEGSPFTSIKEVERGIFSLQAWGMKCISIVVFKGDGKKFLTHRNRKLLVR